MRRDENERIWKRVERKIDAVEILNFTTSINHSKDTENDDENDIEKNENKNERKNVDMTMMTSIIKNVHTLQKRYYSKAMWSRDRKEKKRIKSTIIILAEKQLLHEISQILRNSELSVIRDDRISIVTRRSSDKNQSKFDLLTFRISVITRYLQRNFKFICRIRAREYSVYKRRDQTHSLHDKLIHQLHRKCKIDIVDYSSAILSMYIWKTWSAIDL